MRKRNWMALMTIGMLLPAAGSADETQSAENTVEEVPFVTLPAEFLLAEQGPASSWQPLRSIQTMEYADNWTRPIPDLEFQDGGALERISRLRSLSLLTLAEFGQSRLFLGVNAEGLVGLHFNVLPRDDHERYMEVVRLPYLAGIEPDSELHAPDSK